MPPASEKLASQNNSNNTTLSQLSEERATKSNAIEIPQISLPKGIEKDDVPLTGLT